MATHCRILAWSIPWTEEPGGLQSIGSQRVGHDWCDFTQHRGLQRRPSQFSGSEPKACSVCADWFKLTGNSASQRHSETWVFSPPQALPSSEPCAFTCLARAKVHLRVPAGGKRRAGGDPWWHIPFSFQLLVRICHLTPCIHNSKKGPGKQSPLKQAGAQLQLCLATEDAGGQRALLSRFDPWVGKIPWRRKWQPTPVLLPGKSHGQRSLVGYSPWGRKESDMT